MMGRYFIWLVVGFAALYLVLMGWPPQDPDGDMHLQEFARLPVTDGGRVKPIDTVARTSLMVISNRQTFQDDKDDTQPAIKWLLDVMTSPAQPGGVAIQEKVFRIENDQVLSLLGLKERPGLRYSLAEIAPKIQQLDQRNKEARKVESGKRDVYDQKVIELADHVHLYQQLAGWEVPLNPETANMPDDTQLLLKLAVLETPLAVPPQSPGEEWKSFRQVVEGWRTGGQDNTDFRSLMRILLSYSQGDAKQFNSELASYQKHLAEQVPDEMASSRFEVFYNHLEPFYVCSIFYVLVFLLACFGWLGWTRPLNQAAFWLAVLTLMVHTGALFARMYMMHRPLVFVTNLYSSAVYIGCASVFAGLVLETIFPVGIGIIVASVLGFTTTLIAHHLAADGDTLEMMRAVLDTNFWLATHVTCVTTGYAATFVAGIVGIKFILRGFFTRSLDKDMTRVFGQMIYGVVCFAMLLSFTGTVLGGIWADQSWGRFWGWDPKENGALIIVLWNALVLHARWGGMVRQRGLAVLAVVGNIVTAWSWFGVNMLGVGLHSYGFMSGAQFWLAGFIGSQLLLIGLGVLPLRFWRSFAVQQAPPGPTHRPGDRNKVPSLASSH